MFRIFPLRDIKPSVPAAAYADACARLQALQAGEAAVADGDVRPECATRLLDHGRATEHVLVLIHGFTSCPHQFQGVAPLLHEQGHTVLLPRLPRHGYRDPLTRATAGLTAAEMIDTVTEAVDIAQGLGQKVTVLGFSLGGVLAAWLAQTRRDLHHVILLSPALGVQALSPRRRAIAAHLLALLPNFFQWWHPALKHQRIGPQHTYPRFPSRGLAALLRLGMLVLKRAKQTRPATGAITIINNPSDPVIDHNVVEQVATKWRNYGATVTTHHFPAAWQLIHDLVDPTQEGQQSERVYPRLLGWIEESLKLSSVASTAADPPFDSAEA